ncbi:hypothetical protein R6Q59_031839 [Mikania micrantha]
MSNRRGKELINEDDDCQAVFKTSTWILEKLRNPNKRSLSSSSTSKTIDINPPERQPENPPEYEQPAYTTEQRPPLLVNICYWKKSGFPEKCMGQRVNEDYIQPHNEK